MPAMGALQFSFTWVCKLNISGTFQPLATHGLFKSTTNKMTSSRLTVKDLTERHRHSWCGCSPLTFGQIGNFWAREVIFGHSWRAQKLLSWPKVAKLPKKCWAAKLQPAPPANSNSTATPMQKGWDWDSLPEPPHVGQLLSRVHVLIRKLLSKLLVLEERHQFTVAKDFVPRRKLSQYKF